MLRTDYSVYSVFQDATPLLYPLGFIEAILAATLNFHAPGLVESRCGC